MSQPPSHAVARGAFDGVATKVAPEWPTLGVAVVIYAGWIAATWWHAAIPTVPLIAIGAILIAWHGSLQHETIHGHPSRRTWVNIALGFPPIALWLPYAIYRHSHVAHHSSASLTDPLLDPESRYLSHDVGLSGLAARVQSTLAGRLMCGPPIAVATLIVGEAQRGLRHPRHVARDWLPHLLGVAVIVAWLDWTGFGVLRYVLVFVYPGTAITLLRSFAEHRADLPNPGRAATVERGGVLGLLFLNNNLHAAHHDRPDLPWYRLPAHYRAHYTRLTGDGAGTYRGYGSIVARFLLRRHDVLVHPRHASPRQ